MKYHFSFIGAIKNFDNSLYWQVLGKESLSFHAGECKLIHNIHPRQSLKIKKHLCFNVANIAWSVLSSKLKFLWEHMPAILKFLS